MLINSIVKINRVIGSIEQKKEHAYSFLGLHLFSISIFGFEFYFYFRYLFNFSTRNTVTKYFLLIFIQKEIRLRNILFSLIYI
ncbi:unnamed protein product [Rotaria magnacalcarata]